MRTVGKVLFAGVGCICLGLLPAWVLYEWKSFVVAALLASPLLIEWRWKLLR